VTVTCISVSGSAPCAPGSRMLVGSVELAGTIGGGNLEFLAIEQARKLMGTKERALVQSLPLGPMLSQCCGGRVTLLYERFWPSDKAFFEAARQVEGTILTRCKPQDYDKWLTGAGPVISLIGNTAPDISRTTRTGLCQAEYWLDSTCSERALVCIFGAGHVGKALVQVLQVVDCDVLVIDPREGITEQLPEETRLLQSDDPDTMAAWWRSGAVAIVLTHSHELDYRWVSAILLRTDSRYCGLIGSKTKRARFIRRLRADGLTERQIEHLTCPIGIPALKSKDPGAVAVSTAAQILPLLANVSTFGAEQSCDCALPSRATFMGIYQ
jgi:xanthine dehydrogenase accessory factor